MLAPWAGILAVVAGTAGPGPDTITVGPGGSVATITAALGRVHPGDVVLVHAGTYREPTITVRTAGVTLEGTGWPVLDGNRTHAVVIIAAPDVTIRGFVVTGTGESNLEDRAGIRAREARGCVIEQNRLRDNLFGIYLERSPSCVVRDNDIRATGTSQATTGNGIHLWRSDAVHVERNYVSGHRDGIYFEFSSGGVTRGNRSERNQRYGLHFMYSDSCRYEANRFVANTAGVAVMYSRGITIAGNWFSDAWGGGAYGLLLKEILGGEIAGNQFARNSTGLFVEGAARLLVHDNEFAQNGWAVRVLADATENHFTGNRFSANAFDVATNARSATSTFEGNWWDAYRGYDLDRDGVGDVPFHPVRLFALIVERFPESLVLLRSPAVAVLDAAERVLPVLTPEAFVDRKPLMHRPATPAAPAALP